MAAVLELGSQTFTTVSGTKTVTATPAVNDLIIIIAAHVNRQTDTAPTDDQGGAYDLVETAIKPGLGTGDKIWAYVRTSLISSAVSTVFTHAPGSTGGGGISVLKATGMTRTGASAVRQSTGLDTQALGLPSVTMTDAVLTTNPVIGVVLNEVTPTGLVPRSVPQYTEYVDNGFVTPNTGLNVMAVNSGETSSVINWDNSSTTAFCALVLELDASAAEGSIFPSYYFAQQ